jgi:hypothetical protein
MSVKVHISVTKRYYMRPDVHDAGHYQVMHEDQPGGRYRWVWHEPGLERFGFEPRGKWLPTISEALEDAAKDWDDNGGDSTSDLARRLRLAAAAYRRHGS